MLLNLFLWGVLPHSEQVDWIVYLLRNPRSGAPKYVGETVRTVERRLREHCDKALKSQKTRRDRGIFSFLSIGLAPSIEILESGSGDGFKAAEKYWIAFYRAAGADLWNETSGGQGTVGWGNPELFAARAAKTALTMATRYTPEERAAIADKIRDAHTPEERRERALKIIAGYTPEQLSEYRSKSNAPKWRAARSASAKGWQAAKTPEERSAAASKGNAVRTPEEKRAAAAKREANPNYRQNLSAAATKWQAERTPEERSNSAKRMHAKRTPEERRAIRAKGHATTTPAQRRESAFKGHATRASRKSQGPR